MIRSTGKEELFSAIFDRVAPPPWGNSRVPEPSSSWNTSDGARLSPNINGARANRGEKELLFRVELREVDTGDVEAGRRALLAGGASIFRFGDPKTPGWVAASMGLGPISGAAGVGATGLTVASLPLGPDARFVASQKHNRQQAGHPCQPRISQTHDDVPAESH